MTDKYKYRKEAKSADIESGTEELEAEKREKERGCVSPEQIIDVARNMANSLPTQERIKCELEKGHENPLHGGEVAREDLVYLSDRSFGLRQVNGELVEYAPLSGGVNELAEHRILDEPFGYYWGFNPNNPSVREITLCSGKSGAGVCFTKNQEDEWSGVFIPGDPARSPSKVYKGIAEELNLPTTTDLPERQSTSHHDGKFANDALRNALEKII